MSKNIKSSPLNLLSGAIQALGAYDWGGKSAAATAKAQDEYDDMKRQWVWSLVMYIKMLRIRMLICKIQWRI